MHFVEKPEDILAAKRLLFPGVGAFGACVEALQKKGFMEPLRRGLWCRVAMPRQAIFEGGSALLWHLPRHADALRRL